MPSIGACSESCSQAHCRSLHADLAAPCRILPGVAALLSLPDPRGDT